MLINGLIANSDTQFELGSIAQLFSHFFVWNNLDNFGSNSGGYLLWGKVAQYLLTRLLGFTYASYPGLLCLVLLHLIINLQMIKVCIRLTGRTTISWLTRLLTAVLATLGPIFAYMQVVNMTMYLGFVLSLGAVVFYLKYLNNKKLLNIVISSLLATLSISDFHSLVLFLVFVFMTCAFLLLMGNSKDKAIILKGTAVLFVLILAMNMHWILYNLYNLLTSDKFLISNINFGSSVSSDVLYYLNQRNRIGYSVLINRGDYSFFQKDYIYLINLLASLVIILISFSAPFFIKKGEKPSRYYLSFVFIYVFSLLMSFGPKGPFFIFSFIYNHIPGGVLFRDFYKFFRPMLAAETGMLAISVNSLSANIKLRTINIVLGILLITRLATYLPVFKYINSYDIPKDYLQISDYLASDLSSFRYVVFPLTDWMVKYSWSNPQYDMQDPLVYMTYKPLVHNSVAYAKSPQSLFNLSLEERIISDTPENLIKTLRSVGIKYVLLRKDLNVSQLDKLSVITQTPVPMLDWKTYKPFLDKNTQLERSFETDNFLLYENKDFNPDYLIYGFGNKKEKQVLHWSQVSPASYLLTLNGKGDNKTRSVNFLEQYNPNWVLLKIDVNACKYNGNNTSTFYRGSFGYVAGGFKCDLYIIRRYFDEVFNGKIQKSSPLNYGDNIYFNEWNITEKTENGNSRYALFYAPQAIFVLGACVSFVAALFCVSYLFFHMVYIVFLRIKRCF